MVVMSAKGASPAPEAPARQPHNPISRPQIETVVSRSVAIFGLVFGLQAVPAVLHQMPAAQTAWTVLFGVGMPLFSSVIGMGLGYWLGFSPGGTAMLAILAASASYIAVPAAMRISVPEANPTLSLAASLGVTFPFNVLVGIPIYHAMTNHLFAFIGR